MDRRTMQRFAHRRRFVLAVLFSLSVVVESSDRIKRSSVQPLSAESKKLILDLHNELRSKEGAADMNKLVWDYDLEREAMEYNAECIYEHNKQTGSDKYGQNLYVTSESTADLRQGTMMWFDEKDDYSFDSMYCWGVCGHYTQLVWAKTDRMGCSAHYCSRLRSFSYGSGTHVICNYRPAGNWVGQHPYRKDPPCTKCYSGAGFCSDNLCVKDCSRETGPCECKAICDNCGILDRHTCKCTCKAGWMGTACTRPCKDGALCRKGYPERWCHKDYVKAACPSMCRLCNGTAATTCSVPNKLQPDSAVCLFEKRTTPFFCVALVAWSFVVTSL